MLTEKQITELGKPFELKEHGFVQKNPYILKSAIRARLNRITPGWQLLAPELMAVDGDVVIMKGGIRIGEITRYGVGAGPILRADKNGVVFDGAKLMGMIAKAYKTAATDILPRAALEFGLGEYLKDKPRSINEDNFAGWLAKLTAVPVDPNAWVPENILLWGAKWKTKDLTDAQLMKALGIEGKWSNFTGTIAEADKAVEAFINISQLDAPATTKATTASTSAPFAKIDCPIHLLETGDVVIEEYKTVGSGPAVNRYEIVKNFGMIAGGKQCSLTVKTLVTGEVKKVTWLGSTRTLCDGPKVRAYANDPDVCLPARNGSKPMWDKQIAEPVSV